MGRKKKQQQQHTKENGSTTGGNNQEELLKTLGDFTSKENWDQFFTIRGTDDSFEWYAEWPQLRTLLTAQLLSSPSLRTPESAGVQAEEVAILVPGCGNSKLSERLYDAGFRNITNVDFSKVVISDMLRRNLRERPGMKWRVMDMTKMQFADESFDAVVDKGGLDALMEPELGSRLGNQYLSEVKRLLKAGGKFICLTLAESHVLGLLFSKFRFGWKMSLYTIAKEPSSRNIKLQTFMVVVEKDISTSVSEISSFMDEYSVESHGNQARELYEALERERKVRSEYSNGGDILYSLEDLTLGAKGNLKELEPGRRLKLILGEPGVSRFYNAILFDAKPDLGQDSDDDKEPISYQFAAFIVPKMRVDDWLFSSEEGQWLIVATSKAARLVMILLDSSNSNFSMQDIQTDLSPLVMQLAPKDCGDGVPIPFMAASDGIKQQTIVNQVTSALTGPIIVDDVIYQQVDDYDDDLKCDPSKDLIFRRLTFQRSQSLVQSEALLSKEGSNAVSREIEEKDVQTASKSKKKGKQGKIGSHSSTFHVDHNYLASSYHNGIISGLMLISLHLKGSSSARGMSKTAVIGLGAGLLPMFMKNCLPTLNIEVVELDHVVLDVAKQYFGFREDDRLQVHITDGIKFVTGKADAEAGKLDILIVDVDSSDSSSGLTCPAADFVTESFLLAAKNSLSEEGLFIINLVSRSSTVKDAVYSSLKTVFGNLLSLKLEKDVNEVIFALKKDTPITEDELSKACDELAKSLELEKHEWCQRVVDASKLIKPLI